MDMQLDGKIILIYNIQNHFDESVLIWFLNFFSDIRQLEHVPGRSINLAMSVRGLSAMNSIGLGKEEFI